MIVYAIIDLRSGPDHPLEDAVETFIRRGDAERFVEEGRSDDPELTSYLRIEGREFEVGGRGVHSRTARGKREVTNGRSVIPLIATTERATVSVAARRVAVV